MKRFNLSAVLVLVPLLMLMLFSAVFAADGASKANIWQTVAGVFAFLTTGTGAWIFKNMRLVKDLREAVVKLVQAFAAIQIFVRKAPDELKVIPEYVRMMESLDMASEEIADILERFNATKKYSSLLRTAIHASMYNGSALAGAMRDEISVDSEITKAFDKALAELSRK